MFTIADATKKQVHMAIVKPLKQFAEERIIDSREKESFLDFCDSIKVRGSLVVDVTSFEHYWILYVHDKEKHSKKK